MFEDYKDFMDQQHPKQDISTFYGGSSATYLATKLQNINTKSKFTPLKGLL